MTPETEKKTVLDEALESAIQTAENQSKSIALYAKLTGIMDGIDLSDVSYVSCWSYGDNSHV